MPNFYVSKKFTPDLKHTKVESGFGLSKNEANLDSSRNTIHVAANLANAWTESKQGMSKFPMNDSKMFGNYMEVNEPQKPSAYPTTVGITSRNLKGG